MTATANAPKKERYRLVAGIHHMPNLENAHLPPQDPARTTLLKKGAILESETQLDLIFPNKWEKALLEDGNVIVSQERRNQVTDLIAAGHWKDDDRNFLERLSDDGFERILRHALKDQEQKPPATSALGADVTSKFQQAYDEGFRVWINSAGKYQVTQKSGGKPLNAKLLKEEEVEKFVADYLKEYRQK